MTYRVVTKIPVNRERKMNAMRSAGYHNDMGTWVRLYCEEKPRIAYAKANELWRQGQDAKERGVKCNCTACKEAAT